ncbi:MAG TPA: hypothetical protein VIH01_14015 [Blastococcus sp.]
MAVPRRQTERCGAAAERDLGPGAHFAVDATAALGEFERIAAGHPVFRVTVRAPGDG